MMRLFRALPIAGLFAMTGLFASAATLEVGSGKTYTDIQSAIDAATEGEDTVLVYDGIYEIADSLVLEKAITLKSVNGSGSTVITNAFAVPAKPNAVAVHRCIVISNEAVVVSGFTFTGGYLFDNGAAQPDLGKFGAGVFLYSGKLLNSKVTNCRIGKSSAGGALAIMSQDAFVSNCVITLNESLPAAYGYQVLGAGVYAKAGEMVDTEISDNANVGAPYPRAGGVYIGSSGDNKINFTMRRCKVVRNTCPNASYVSYWGCAGGIYVEGRNPLIENTLIADNSTAANGGGIYTGFSNYTEQKFVNCTIVNNTAAYGGGVCMANNYARFYNCIIQGNTVTGGDTSDYKPELTGGPGIHYYGLSPVDLNATNAKSTGNVRDSATFKTGTYELAAGSAGYDAGSTNYFSWLATTVDLNGEARVWNLDQGGKIDIGCYEYSVKGLDVSITASTTDTNVISGATVRYTCNVMPAGSSHTTRWKVDGVAAGTDDFLDVTYQVLGSHKIELTVTDSASVPYEATPIATFVYPKDLYVVTAAKHPGHVPVSPYVDVAGAATNIADAIAAAGNGSVVHVESGEYAISEELLVEKGLRLQAEADRSQTVVRRQGGNMRLLNLSHDDAVVSGFTFRDGYSKGTAMKGGGILMRAGGTLTNCTVTGCSLTANQDNAGAGVYMQNGLVVDCDITDNTNSVNDASYTHGKGGGIYMGNGEVRNCRILRNAMTTNSGDDNHCQPGGGIYLFRGTVIGCLVADNYCRSWGGGIYASDVGTVISNVTLAGNVAHGSAGIHYSDDWRGYGSRSAFLCNSALAANTSATGGQFFQSTNAVTVTYCFGPEGELPCDLANTNNVFGTDARFRNRQYVPYASSPLFDAGVFADWMLGTKDLRGRPRVTERRKVTIGCYQVEPSGMTLLIR